MDWEDAIMHKYSRILIDLWMKYNIFPSSLKNVNWVVLRNQIWFEGRYWTSSKILLVTFLCDTVYVVEIKVTCQNWNNYCNDGNCNLLVRKRSQCSRLHLSCRHSSRKGKGSHRRRGSGKNDDDVIAFWRLWKDLHNIV